jgi:peptidoglycan/xylan/chitin deacetylase (PgdA/CDA1 family)
MNHTYSHRSFTGYSTGTSPLSYKQRAGELRKTESVVQRIAGASTKRARRPADLSVYSCSKGTGLLAKFLENLPSMHWGE